MRLLIRGVLYCLLGLGLVYGGLNAVEKGLAELTALEAPPGAFVFKREATGELAVTFGGKTVLFDPAGLLCSLKEWWDRLGLF